MRTKYDVEFSAGAVRKNLERLTDQIYALLPMREEGGNWGGPLDTLEEELAGMNELLLKQEADLFRLLCKLEGLHLLADENDFLLFRRTIFECLNLLAKMQKKCLD